MSEIRSPPGLFCFFHFPGTNRARMAPKIWFESFEVGNDDSGSTIGKIEVCKKFGIGTRESNESVFRGLDEGVYVKSEIFVDFVIERISCRVRWFTTVGSPSPYEKGDFRKICN
jgi:hypothetical protein